MTSYDADLYSVGFDLGGTNLKMVALAPDGSELGRWTEASGDDPDSWVRKLVDLLSALRTRTGRGATWIGIAAPGLAGRDRRSIAWMQGRLEAIAGLDWTEALGLGTPVPVVNDAHAALLGEAWQGAAAGCSNVMMLTLGTGVGGGALVDGRLLLGHIGRAGHLGHICLDPDGPAGIVGTPGTLEEAIGDCTVSRRSNGRFTSTEALVHAHRSGDPEATEIWLRSVYVLACGIVSLINVLDPEVVVIGGGIARAGHELFQPLTRFVHSLEWRPTGFSVPIVPARLGPFAGAYGAAHHALTGCAT